MMRINKYIDIRQEIEIELTVEDITLTLENSGEGLSATLRELNDVVVFLKGIPHSIIVEMSNEQKEVISTFLSEQANRFDVETAW